MSVPRAFFGLVSVLIVLGILMLSTSRTEMASIVTLMMDRDTTTTRTTDTTVQAKKRIPIVQSLSVRIHNGEYPASIELPSRRLVVQAGINVMFWNNGMEQLCPLLQTMKEIAIDGAGAGLEALMIQAARQQPQQPQHGMNLTKTRFLWNPQPDPFSSSVSLSSKVPPPPPLLNISVPICQMSKDGQLGQGNWVTAVYCVRMAAAWHGVDLQFLCLDQHDTKIQQTLLLPWFTGYFSAAAQPLVHAEKLDRSTACQSRYPLLRLDFMAQHIQDDLRQMAIAMVGNRTHAVPGQDLEDNMNGSNNINNNNINNNTRLVPNVVLLDDVVIHFRCGDVMGGARRHDFGMIKFNAYKQVIHVPTTRSVGILTQPFDAGMAVRWQDRRRLAACKRATFLLVDYLREQVFHNDSTVRITIHNTVNETLPLAYARMVMANQSIVSLSSFGIFPVIGTFGHGYFQKGNRGVNPFANYLPSIMPNMHMMTAPVLSTWTILKMFNDPNISEDGVMQWFVSD